MRNVSNQDLKPILVSYPKPLVSVTLPKSIPPGSSADGSIKLKEPDLKRSFEKSVTIQLSDAANTRFTIPISRGSILSKVLPAKGLSSQH